MDLLFHNDELVVTVRGDTSHTASNVCSARKDILPLTCDFNKVLRKISWNIGECYTKIEVGNAFFISAETGVYYCHREGLEPVLDKLLNLYPDEPKWMIELVENETSNDLCSKLKYEVKINQERQSYRLIFYNSYRSYQCVFAPGFILDLKEDQARSCQKYVGNERTSHTTRTYKLEIRNLSGTPNSEIWVYDALNRSSKTILENKVMNIVPASQDRFVLFGTNISIIQVYENSLASPNSESGTTLDHITVIPRYTSRILCRSAAPSLGFSYGGYLDCNSIVAQCLHCSLGVVRLPLPKCLR